ncbi:hypothetical protein LROSL3_1561 [Furfurilactobacillus rossiae]|nr:hypothetical protein LROSL2_1560 [Furfurilactobacillus rossiae]QLE69340.1 hypothetical protein LROSL3_1561 [Furfurilactobacillus rossiae]
MEKNDLILPSQSAQNALEGYVNLRERVFLNGCIANGYSAAGSTLNSDSAMDSWLKEGRSLTELGTRMKTVACEVMICRSIEKGLLPFKYAFVYNTAHHHKYFRVFSDERGFHMTVNHVPAGNRPHRRAQYRDDENNNYQTFLKLGDLDEKNDVLFSSVDDEYLELDHGGKKIPNFVCLGIPQKGADIWATRIDLVGEMRSLTPGAFNTSAIGPSTIDPSEIAAYQKEESTD